MVKTFQCSALLVHTTGYAGNIERALCAFATGQVGDCGVGEEFALLASAEMVHKDWWDAHVKQVGDEHGVKRPCSIAATPGWLNNGMGEHYPANAPPERIQAMREAGWKAWEQVRESYVGGVKKRLASGDFEPDEKKSGWTREACERTVDEYEKELERMKAEPLRGYQAMLSVAIFVDEFPPFDVRREFEQRVARYLAEHKAVAEQAGGSMARWVKEGPVELIGIEAREARPAKAKGRPGA